LAALAATADKNPEIEILLNAQITSALTFPLRQKSKRPMKILVCGSRALRDERMVFQVLDDLRDGVGPNSPARLISCVVTGAASGADYLAEKWAKKREIAYRGHPAPWHTHDPRWCRCDITVRGGISPATCAGAGPWRNAEMIRRENTRSFPVSLCVAFPGSTGTAHMVRLARESGIEILEVAPC
jgi:hypothetical protein